MLEYSNLNETSRQQAYPVEQSQRSSMSAHLRLLFIHFCDSEKKHVPVSSNIT